MRRIAPPSALIVSMLALSCAGVPPGGGEIGVGGSGNVGSTGGVGYGVGGGEWGGDSSGGTSAMSTTEVGASTGGTSSLGTETGGTTSLETGGTTAVGPECGDGTIEPGEDCDDSNSTPGDGCSGVCRTEVNFVCTTPGKPCVSTVVCGDGSVTGNEVCDDRNTLPNDGCASDCMSVDLGYTCPTPGEPCIIGGTAVCGNSSIETGESCDDGNANSGEGCSSKCQLESGYTCPKPGQACELNQYCGDGLLNGQEQCDDANRRPGDCCDGNCRLEPNCSCTTPSPALVPPRQVCASTMVCGNGTREGSEACDDGGNAPEDGCSADCTTVEPGYNCPHEGGACTAVPKQVCGNGILETNEYCDDGNSSPSDGCSAACEVEPGYTCSAPGHLCTAIAYCGDGIVNYVRGETCDDGHALAGDGCSTNCTIELGWSCDNTKQSDVPPVPSVCTNITVCGDKKVTGAETCDDGNAKAADGCSATCQLESGWVCPVVGAACRAAKCGDKLVAGTESCDDGNTTPSDGCSVTCQREDGWVCPNPGQPCRKTVCGDAVPEGSEQCDKGDLIPYDGCSPSCTREPLCSGGTCTAVCGDGLKFPQEDCDDGNTRSGDGCSAECKSEAGWKCPVVTQSPPATLSIPILVRDVMADGTPATTAHPAGHTDFEHYNCGLATGLLNIQLGSDGKPTYLSAKGSATSCGGPVIASATSFYSWYHDDPLNSVIAMSMTLVKQSDGSYLFDSSNDEPYKTIGGFFPINGQGWQSPTSCAPCQVSKPPSWCSQCPNNSKTAYNGKNFHFTSELRYQFTYAGGEVLNFTGDDDVWVYINGRLAVDLGGIHGATNGSITLNGSKATELSLTVGGMYEIALFQAERHTSASNYKLTLNGFVHAISQCVSTCGDGVVTSVEACDLGTDKNTGSYGGCNPDCTLAPNCGDQIVQAEGATPEQCDDGVNITLYDNSKKACGPSCRLPHFCGDGNLDGGFGEFCDNGTRNSDSAYGLGECDSKCMPAPSCGDGFKYATEQCDDGSDNGTKSSLCDTTCQLKCGNGIQDPGEQCDRGAAQNVGGYNGCNANCTLAAYCGDGFKQGSEQCDDGKNDGSYGTCMPGCILAGYCGDGDLQNPPELCDSGSLNTPSAYGLALCTDQCQPAPYCGDKKVDGQFGEKCDDGVNSGEPGSCMQDCLGWVPLPTCGNGVVDVGEQCDEGADNGDPESPCDVRCRIHCGNGVVDGNEECDNGINDGTYGGCTWNCQYAAFCGDGIKNGQEQCDLGWSNQADAYGQGGCTTTCKNAAYCGDGRVQSPPEACDGQPNCDSACHWWSAG